MGITLFIIPPALFPDPANGFQVLRSMHMGGGFNNFVAPDQDDISQDYSEFLTWWSPGQYLVPYFFKLLTGCNMGQAIAITIVFCTLFGLAGFYKFFGKVGFSPLISALSLVVVAIQLAFFVPFVYYNGGEILLFAFEGWFLYGCITFHRAGIKMALFVLFAGWIGFFCKSSFIWIYMAGICCLWIRLPVNSKSVFQWVKKGLWVGIPAMLSLAAIYITFLSKGRSPATAGKGLKLTAEVFGFPLASPLLSGFSIDDFVHGLYYNFGKPMFSPCQALGILLLLAVFSLLLIILIIRRFNKTYYRLFVAVFYFGAFLFFGFSYLLQLNISYEARHFRILGILIVPGVIYLLAQAKPAYLVIFSMICLLIACISVNYLIKGFRINGSSARGVTGIAQPNIDQQSLNTIMKIDRENKNATFVFVSNDIGLEVLHNRIINLLPIGDDLKIDMDDYTYAGFAGPLFIILPESYNGPKEKMVMKSFPGYVGFNISMLSDNYVLYEARMRRKLIK